MGIIYKVTNLFTGKCYIGQTIQSLKERKRQHYKFCKKKKNYKFSNTLNKYSREMFKWEILENDVPTCLLNSLECYYINFYNSYFEGYNSTPGDEGTRKFFRKPTLKTIRNTKTLYNLKTQEIVTTNAYDFIRNFKTPLKNHSQIYLLFQGKFLRYFNWILLENIKIYERNRERNIIKTRERFIDKNIYTFYNEQTEIFFTGTRQEFMVKHGLSSKGCISQLINGKLHKHKNWLLYKNK